MEVIRLLLLVFGIANSRFIENTETRKLITEIKLKLKYWTEKTYASGAYWRMHHRADLSSEHHHVILRVQRPDGDKEVLLIVR